MANKSQQEHSLVISALDKTKATFSSIQSNLKGLAGTVTSVKGQLAGVGIALSTASFASLVKGAIESTAALKKLQIQTGLSAEAISGINYATKGDTEQVGKALSQLSKQAFDASRGGDEAKKNFAALGISFKNANGSLKTSEQLFGDVAGAISKLPDGLEKSALAQKIFGEEGAKLIPMLNKGKDVFKILADEARKYGVVLNQETIDASAAFVKSTEKISQVLDSSSKLVAAKMAPGLALIATALQGVVQEQSDLQDKNAQLGESTTDWASTAVTGISFVMDAFAGAKRVVVNFGEQIGFLLATYVTFVSTGIDGLSALATAAKQALTGDLAGASKTLADFDAQSEKTLQNMTEQADDFNKKSAERFAQDLPGQALRRNFEKAKKAQADARQATAQHQAGVLTAEQQFNNKMLDLQKSLAKGMQDALAKQLEAVDKLEKKLKEARDRQKNVKDDFQKSRDELKFGSIAAGESGNRNADIENALAAAKKAKAAGKFDIVDSETKKVLSYLQEDKNAQPSRQKAFDEQMGELAKQIQETLAKRDSASGDDEYNGLQEQVYNLLDARAGLARRGPGKGLGDYERDKYLTQAEGLAQEAADQNVQTLEKQAKEANQKLDELYAKIQRLQDVKITLDQEAAVKNVNDLLKVLQDNIDKNPLVITAVNAPSETDAQKKARELTPVSLQGGSTLSALGNARLPNPATGGAVGSISDSGAAPTQIVNLTVPGVGTYPMQSNADVVAQINRDFQRERLKAGDQ